MDFSIPTTLKSSARICGTEGLVPYGRPCVRGPDTVLIPVIAAKNTGFDASSLREHASCFVTQFKPSWNIPTSSDWRLYEFQQRKSFPSKQPPQRNLLDCFIHHRTLTAQVLVWVLIEGLSEPDTTCLPDSRLRWMRKIGGSCIEGQNTMEPDLDFKEETVS